MTRLLCLDLGMPQRTIGRSSSFFDIEAISVVKQFRFELAPDLAHVRDHIPQT